MDDKPVIAGRAPIVVTLQPGSYRWCACGSSKNQPYCDGSHRGSPFRPVLIQIDVEKQVAFCNCKHTKTPGLCDGSHRTLPPA